MRISGRTELIAHIGHPTHAFKAPLIYNPWFEQAGVDAVVVPMACRAGDLEPLLRAAQRRGCRFQVGTDMLFEQIPAYLEFFGLPSATPDVLRACARLDG
ncbi:hypothetical protein MOJ79_06455 [Calidifontimicrobium sp. SYSU G02091]|nr:hypothetical protein [Calidifontimicrobium sp. SYSU G02091]MCI1191480.1 hypothetical protein [Calidifontimicrobium sp. SYSU G02091]